MFETDLWTTLWLVLGFGAQALFGARFIVQWIASEKAGDSVVPVSFWYLSIAGSTMLLVYAIHRADPVFILGQSTGTLIYVRNLWLIYKRRAREKKEHQPQLDREALDHLSHSH